MIYNVKLNTPFFQAKKYVHMESKDCLILENELLRRLEDDDEVLFNISFTRFNVHEKRIITVSKIRQLLENNRARTRYNLSSGTYCININRHDCDLYEE